MRIEKSIDKSFAFSFHFELCGSRKYPYPPTEGIFHMTPPPLWIFQKRPTNYTPPPLRKFQFFPKPPGNISISCLKRKIS